MVVGGSRLHLRKKVNVVNVVKKFKISAWRKTAWRKTAILEVVKKLLSCIMWGHGGILVSLLDFRFEGRWFDTHSLPSCCFLGQEVAILSVASHYRNQVKLRLVRVTLACERLYPILLKVIESQVFMF